MYKCLKCENVEFNSYNSLSKHMCRTHKMDPIMVRVEYCFNGVWPKCKCGCVECGMGGKLHIHHDKEKMCDVVKKHMVDMNIIEDFELKKSIVNKIIDYHINNKVSGITLCDECHKNKHPSLNF